MKSSLTPIKSVGELLSIMKGYYLITIFLPLLM
jgi:hypothetical protein